MRSVRDEVKSRGADYRGRIRPSGVDDANERGVAARIEFRPEGHAKVTFTISREFVETARALDWTTGELVAEAIGIAIPRSADLMGP